MAKQNNGYKQSNPAITTNTEVVAETVSEVVEVVEEVVAETTAVVEAAPITPVVIDTTVAPTTFAAKINNLKEKGTSAQKALIENIEQYVANMGPGVQVSNENGARIQFRFWTILRNVINNTPSEEFKANWTLLLEFFKHYSTDKGYGALGSLSIYRFAAYWTQSIELLTQFQAVLCLIENSIDADSATIKMDKRFNFNKLAGEITEQGRSRLINYYK